MGTSITSSSHGDIQAYTPESTPHTAIFSSSASIMCQVTSFFCGCADLRKGALIIGIVKLVMLLIDVVWSLLTVFVFAGSAAVVVGTVANARPPQNNGFGNGVGFGNGGGFGSGKHHRAVRDTRVSADEATAVATAAV